jgi:ubiquinone/menaquinone biosynthesis C-methylase UbiE
MKLNCAETLLVNNPFRELSQRYFEAPLFRRMAGSLEGARVLEIGCGRGAGVDVLLSQLNAAQVYGIDLDLAQVRRARKRLARESHRVTLATADAERLPFFDAFFDAVADFGALHHALRWQSAVWEIARVLKPGGRFLFGEVTAAALNRRIYKLLLEHPETNRFSEAEFLAELAVNGMRLLSEPRRVLFGDIFIAAARRD